MIDTKLLEALTKADEMSHVLFGELIAINNYEEAIKLIKNAIKKLKKKQTKRNTAIKQMGTLFDQ